jgi:hypothetical protein
MFFWQYKFNPTPRPGYPDTIWTPDKLPRTIKVLARRKEVMGCSN